LKPNNFQEDPRPVVAHRTSPTNIGLYLLSIVSARDFGWIGTADALDRLEATTATIREMEHFRGHLYNWYDTQELRPLDPRYVSSVDSGNLAGHLIALANACAEWRDAATAPRAVFAGIADAAELAGEAADKLRDAQLSRTTTWRQFDSTLASLQSRLTGVAGGGKAEGLAALAQGRWDFQGSQAGRDGDVGRFRTCRCWSRADMFVATADPAAGGYASWPSCGD
jgi:cyclic beta-1,2-glucan synthetase